MRRCGQLIEKLRENGRRRGMRSQAVQRNERLAGVVNRLPERDHLIFELATRNARTGVEHYLEIVHERFGGTNRFAVYVDCERWRNGWSRSRFVKWIFDQIDAVQLRLAG